MRVATQAAYNSLSVLLSCGKINTFLKWRNLHVKVTIEIENNNNKMKSNYFEK